MEQETTEDCMKELKFITHGTRNLTIKVRPEKQLVTIAGKKVIVSEQKTTQTRNHCMR